MARYIDADKLLKKKWDADTRCGYVQVVDVGTIEEQPTADVVEVVHGYWEAYPTRNYKRCSVCKTEYYKLYNGFKGNYCPNCGAKMDGKKVQDDL